MARELICRDLGFDCEGVVVAESDAEVVAQATQHAREVHGMTDEALGDPAFAEQIRSRIHEQDAHD